MEYYDIIVCTYSLYVVTIINLSDNLLISITFQLHEMLYELNRYIFFKTFSYFNYTFWLLYIILYILFDIVRLYNHFIDDYILEDGKYFRKYRKSLNKIYFLLF